MMTQRTSHLQEKAQPLLDLSNDERISLIRKGVFIDLPRFKPIFDWLNVLLEWPETVRPDCLLLVAESNSGKSSIFERFREEANGSNDPNHEVSPVRVVMINTPPTGDRLAFYQRLIDALFGAFSGSAKLATARSQAIRQLKAHGVRLVLLDELHDAMSGTLRQQELFITELKQFMSESKIMIAAAGLEKAPALFARDSQLTSRFRTLDVAPFKHDEELGTLLYGLGRRLPLRRPSDLLDEKIVEEVSRRAEGAIGDIYSLLAHCAIKAIEDGSEQITLKGIRSADWQRPTQRRAFTRKGRFALKAEQKLNDALFAQQEDGDVGDEPQAEPPSAVGTPAPEPPVVKPAGTAAISPTRGKGTCKGAAAGKPATQATGTQGTASAAKRKPATPAKPAVKAPAKEVAKKKTG